MLKIAIEFDMEAQAVTKIDAPGIKNLGFLAAVLDMAREQAKFEANLARARDLQAKAQEEMSRQQGARHRQEQLDRKLRLG